MTHVTEEMKAAALKALENWVRDPMPMKVQRGELTPFEKELCNQVPTLRALLAPAKSVNYYNPHDSLFENKEREEMESTHYSAPYTVTDDVQKICKKMREAIDYRNNLIANNFVARPTLTLCIEDAETLIKAADKWNTRPSDAKCEKLVEALEKYADDKNYPEIDIMLGNGQSVKGMGFGTIGSEVARKALSEHRESMGVK